MKERRREVLQKLSCLPRKIIQLNGHENLTEFVLHELCQSDCFNIDKAAYFVDNPDFDCFKGVAGHCRHERYSCPQGDIWCDPSAFSDHMRKSSFNAQVRQFACESLRKKGQSDEQIAQCVANNLGIKCCGFYSWDMKHDNHGIFVYERECQGDNCDDYLLDGLSLLSFCPVF